MSRKILAGNYELPIQSHYDAMEQMHIIYEWAETQNYDWIARCACVEDLAALYFFIVEEMNQCNVEDLYDIIKSEMRKSDNLLNAYDTLIWRKMLAFNSAVGFEFFKAEDFTFSKF